MGKLRVLSGAQVCGILEAHGFVWVRQSGSHVIMRFDDGSVRLSVPVPNHDVIRAGTLSSIIRQSRLPRKLFEVT